MIYTSSLPTTSFPLLPIRVLPASFISAASHTRSSRNQSLPRNAMLWCCFRVCLSVTSLCSTKMARSRNTITVSHNSPGGLVFWRHKISAKFDRASPHGGAKCRCMEWAKIGHFQQLTGYISKMAHGRRTRVRYRIVDRVELFRLTRETFRQRFDSVVIYFFQFRLQIFRRGVGIFSHFFLCCFYFLLKVYVNFSSVTLLSYL